MFRSTTIIREFVLNLAKVIFMLKHSVKLRCCMLFGDVAACHRAFMGPCIANVFSSTTNKMRRYTIYLFLWNALHVSGGSSAHHQELRTVYTASGTLSKLYCYLPLSWKRWNYLTKYPMLYKQFWGPDDGRRNPLKHVGHFTEINKLCNVASFWLYLEILSQCTKPMNVKNWFAG